MYVQGNVDAGAHAGKSPKSRPHAVLQSTLLPGGDLSLSPRYNLATGKADVRVDYDTRISVDADKYRQKLTVARRIKNDDNSIVPSITSDGDVEVEYRRVVRDAFIRHGKQLATDPTIDSFEDQSQVHTKRDLGSPRHFS